MAFTPESRAKSRLAFQSPQRREARRIEFARRLRLAKADKGILKLSVRAFVQYGPRFSEWYLPGTELRINLDEAVDVLDLLRDTVRFWRAWRPGRRRTDQSVESARRAFEIWERSSTDLKP